MLLLLMLLGLMLMILLYISMQSKIIGISPSHIISRSNINRGSGGRSNQKKRLSHSRQESLTM